MYKYKLAYTTPDKTVLLEDLFLRLRDYKIV